jgi:hypothetical protein
MSDQGYLRFRIHGRSITRQISADLGSKHSQRCSFFGDPESIVTEALNSLLILLEHCTVLKGTEGFTYIA